MAIGKVGSFATVEPALVDFGSMVERNIDKIKAEEQAKAQAKAKAEQAKRESVKDIKEPVVPVKTGIAYVDEGVSAAVSPQYEIYTEALLNGDEKTARKAARSINMVSSTATLLNEKMDAFQKKIESDKNINPEAYDEIMKQLTNVEKEKYKVIFNEDGDGLISVMNQDGTYPEPTNITDYVNNLMNAPRNFNELDNTNKVIETILASKTESGNYLFNKKITDINSEESKPQVEAIRNQARTQSTNNDAMFNWYKKERANDGSLPFKTSGWTKDEREKAEDYYFNNYLNSYNKEIEAGFGRPGGSGGRSGGGNSGLSPVVPFFYKTSLQAQPAMNKLKEQYPDLKGRQYKLTNTKLPEFGGKDLVLAYATAGDDPQFVFQLQDPNRFGFSQGGATGGGSEFNYSFVKPGDDGYGAAVSNALVEFNVSSAKELQELLRGEINTSGY
jgi:hypothetical protein